MVLRACVTLAMFSFCLVCACSGSPLGDGLPADIDCTSCHGFAGEPAPPFSLDGSIDPGQIGVGAHREHLRDGVVRAALACSECHRVPASVDAEGHVDPLPAEVIFGELATTDGVDPVWNRDAASCSATYCHGATLAGGTGKEPVWTRVDGSQATCGSCHGHPPPLPHPANTDCHACHAQTVTSAGSIDIGGGKHLDGVLDSLPESCSLCHGDAVSPAPPVDVAGNSDPGERGVGAHRSHLGVSTWHAEVGCQECHVVPRRLSDPGHADDALPAELTWGTRATADGAVPGFDPTALSCSGVYCHGATLQHPGGTNTAPVWTVVDGSQAACGTCHGNPPGPPHPAGTACEVCHDQVMGPQQSWVDPARHIDGVVDVTDYHPEGYDAGSVHGHDHNDDPAACQPCHGDDFLGGQVGVSCETCHPGFRSNCVFCHGDVDNQTGAPPEDVAGGTGTALRGVGAHTAHLNGGSSWRADMACSACHRVPAHADDPGHIDPRPAELTWSGVAVRDGAAPDFDGVTCSGVYCHGETLYPGGTNTTPGWTTVDGTQAACGTCHGLPPDLPHPAISTCESCHDEVVAAGMTIVAPGRHVDGVVDVSGGCGTCHGIPPVPANENYPGGGGAHAMHAATLGYACRTCHGHDGTGPQHAEGGASVLQTNVDIVFDPAVAFPGGTSMANGGSPSHSHNGGDPTCYVGCHNPVPGDIPDLAHIAVWTDTSISCAECHERPGTEPPVNHDLDPAGNDDATIRAACQECHDHATHTQGSLAIVDPDPTDTDSYANTQVSGQCRTCHDGGPGTFFGGLTPVDQSAFWTTATAHEDVAGLDCADCHDHHGSSSGTVLVNREEDLCATCHTEVAEMDDAATPTHHHVVDGEQSGSQPLECTTCHDPHIVQKVPWRPIVNPDTGALWPANDVPADSGDDPATARNDSHAFCITCHDGSWPGAIDVAAELANENVIHTAFHDGDKNLHNEHRKKLGEDTGPMPCTYCHNVHGNTGTAGIQRGALLYDWLQVNEFPYWRKNSCSTSDPLNDCH